MRPSQSLNTLMSTGYQPPTYKAANSFKPEASASLAAQFLSNPKHLFPEERNCLNFPNEVSCSSQKSWAVARVPMWAHMIVNPFCHVPATSRERHHPPKSSCPLKPPKSMAQKALLLWRSLCLLSVLKRRLSEDLSDRGSTPLKLIRDAPDGLVVPGWKGWQNCKSLALDGREERWGLKCSLCVWGNN